MRNAISFEDDNDGDDGETGGNGGGNNTDGNGSQVTSKFGVKSRKQLPDYIKDLPETSELKMFVTVRPNEVEQKAKLELFKTMTGKTFTFKYDVATDWNTYSEELATLVSSNSAPDSYSVDITQAAFVMGKGVFEDISNYIDATDPLWIETTQNPNDVYTKYKGTRYAVCTSTSVISNGLLYNKKLTDAAVAKSGGTLQDPVTMFYNNKWDWNAFGKFVELITVPGNPEPSVYGASINWAFLVTWIGSTGIDIIKMDDNSKLVSNISDKNVLRTYEYIQSLTAKGCLDRLTWDNIPNRFSSNKIGFISGHVWDYNTPAYLPLKQAGTIQFVPYPKDPEADKYYHNANTNFFAIPKGAKNPYGIAAWEYLGRYMHYNENENFVKAQKDMYATTYGWTDQDYQYYIKDIDKKVTPITFIGNRLTDFDDKRFTEGLVNTALGTPASIINEVKSAHISAVDKFNRS